VLIDVDFSRQQRQKPLRRLREVVFDPRAFSRAAAEAEPLQMLNMRPQPRPFGGPFCAEDLRQRRLDRAVRVLGLCAIVPGFPIHSANMADPLRENKRYLLTALRNRW